jgi:hypothetical protein
MAKGGSREPPFKPLSLGGVGSKPSDRFPKLTLTKCVLYAQNASKIFLMANFPKDLQEINVFEATIGPARFKRYLAEYDGDKEAALRLYIWNARISQAFYLPLQIWEICLRNRVNDFMVWKFGSAWPYDQRKAVRQLKNTDQKILQDSIDRQERARGAPASTDAIAADLSAGFWVRLLGSSYSVPMSWRYNLTRIFPSPAASIWRKGPAGFDMADAHALCEEVLDLRNRVAHHEPLAWMNLAGLHYKIGILTYAMCPASFSYLESHCTVQNLLAERP